MESGRKDIMAKEPTQKVWDDFWEREKSVEDIYPTSISIIENLLSATDVKGKKILEVGAGTGRDSIHLCRNGADVTVIDYSDNALYKVQESIAGSDAPVKLVRGDGTRLPFDDESYDIVFHQGLMEHFKDPLPLFRENVRVLKKGGLLLVDVPQRYHIYTIIKHLLIAFDKWFAGWETEYSIKQLRRIFTDHNMIICREYGDFMVPSLFYRIFRELFGKLGVNLPMYPGKIPLLNRCRKVLKSNLEQNPYLLNFYLNIGVIGKKA